MAEMADFGKSPSQTPETPLPSTPPHGEHGQNEEKTVTDGESVKSAISAKESTLRAIGENDALEYAELVGATEGEL